MFLALDIMQVTFVTVPIADLPTSSLKSQGMGMQAKTSNVTKHMPTYSVPAVGIYLRADGEGPSQCLA